MNDPFRELLSWLLLPFEVIYRISASCFVSIILISIVFACIAALCAFSYGLALDLLSGSPPRPPLPLPTPASSP